MKSRLIGQFHVAVTVQSADPPTDDVPVLAPPHSRPVNSILEDDMPLGIRCSDILLARSVRDGFADLYKLWLVSGSYS